MIETLTRVAVGPALALLAQVLVFPVVGLRVALLNNIRIVALFATLSVLRSCALRRLFDRLARWGP